MCGTVYRAKGALWEGVAINELAEKVADFGEALARPNRGPHDADSQLVRDALVLDGATAPFQLVRHVQDELNRDAPLQKRLTEHRMLLEALQVHDQDQCVRHAHVGPASLQNVASDPLVRSASRGSVNAGEVDEIDLPAPV
ncbi:MAG: hypothetical protein WEG36_01155 [Gemmatimonadota bacterium]